MLNFFTANLNKLASCLAVGPTIASQSDLQTLIKHFSAHPSSRYHQVLFQNVKNKCPKPIDDLPKVSTTLGLDFQFCEQFQDSLCPFPQNSLASLHLSANVNTLPLPETTAPECPGGGAGVLCPVHLSLLIYYNLASPGLLVSVLEM